MIASKNYSADKKLGFGVWATYRAKESCPTFCAMFVKCYAKKGNTNIHFIRASETSQSDPEIISSYIATRPKGDKIRHHVAGDFLENDKTDSQYVNAVIEGHKMRPDLKAWTYTHGWKVLGNIFKGIASLTVNASCDSIADIKEARAMGYDTCMVVAKDSAPVMVVEGEKIVVCPNQVQASRGVNLTCAQCMLCFKKERAYTIGFRQH